MSLHSSRSLPWTDGSGAQQTALLIQLNLAAAAPDVVYIHLNSLPIARHVFRAQPHQHGAEEQLPLQCRVYEGAAPQCQVDEGSC